MSERFRCSVRSAALDEPCYGTASQVQRWLLVEQPGGWGRDAVAQSLLADDVARGLRALARVVGARLLLIRRHGRTAPVRRTCFVAVTTAGVRRVERVVFDDPAELLDRDWSPLRLDEPVGGENVDDPLYLVCTNGGHDSCCAEFGRPLAAALDRVMGDRIWECSHFGGDRFAANLLCLPQGIYYGRVTPEDAGDLIADHEAGLLDLDRYRGRSWQPFVAQAAEALVREQRGLRGIDDLVPSGVVADGGGRFVVTLTGPGGEQLTATVERTESTEPQQLTCRSDSDERPPRYRLLSVTPG